MVIKNLIAMIQRVVKFINVAFAVIMSAWIRLHDVAHIYRVWFLHVLPPQEVTIEEKSNHLLEIIINTIEIQNN